jgi:cysteine desulfurase
MNVNKRVYLDWSAGTPILPEAKVAMERYWLEEFGNPSSIHREGVIARQAIEQAREQVARALLTKPANITFTAGGTEANNLAILGALNALRSTGREWSKMEIITTRLEHPSVLRPIEQLVSLGVKVNYVSVTDTGRVDLVEFEQLLNLNTSLVSIAYANSEIGIVQPVRAIRRIINSVEKKWGNKIVFHTDGAQAPLWLPCCYNQISADILTLDASKCCGPKGVGIVVKSPAISLSPIILGGGQEEGLRAGTENVPGIVATGVALRWAQESWNTRAESVCLVRDFGIKLILNEISGAVLNGPLGDERLANNINISIPGIDTEYLTIVLDSRGFAVSTKSACSSAGGGESVVVRAISADPARARSTLRISIGPDTTNQQLQKLVSVLTEHIYKQKI